MRGSVKYLNVLLATVLLLVLNLTNVFSYDINTVYQQGVKSVVHIRTLFSEEYKILFFKKTKEGVKSGTGFFITSDGHILTNYHVIDNWQEISVMTYSENWYTARVIAYDTTRDLALLKIDTYGRYEPLKLAKTNSIKVGDRVVAIGHPYELSNTLTSGIVSSIRKMDGVEYIQTDVAINPGNSGGPLLNMNCEVVGVNTGGLKNSQGLNFAVSVVEVVNFLNRPIIGVSIYDISKLEPKLIKEFQKLTGYNYGLYIFEVLSGSPAQLAGLKAGDIIISVDGYQAYEFNVLSNAISKKGKGNYLDIVFLRPQGNYYYHFSTKVKIVLPLDIK
ncbi:MAG: trypsin-like peptidase domain-containing protein [Candidatus Jordarchaeaceae archaeon]